MHPEMKTVADYLAIIRRRKWSLLLPLLFIFAIAAVLALTLPPTYRSTSTILIEEQEIPREFVATTVSGFAEQRLQAINQRVMSAPKLQEIIDRFNLYADMRTRHTKEEILARMRKDIKFETISAEVDDQRLGRPSKVAIAFTLAYSGRQPAVVQQVANVLATLYLEENLKVRVRQTEGASRFMEEEMKTVQARLAAIDSRLAAYKQRHIESLPVLAQTNQTEHDRVDQLLEQYNDQLRALREKESEFKTQLAGIPSDAEVRIRNSLHELRLKLTDLKSRVSDQYPDVVKIKHEIAELEKRLSTGGRESTADMNANASYVSVASQLAGIQAEIESTKRQIAIFTEKRKSYRKRIDASPRVEEGHTTLLVERNNYQAKYDDLARKFMEAKVAQGLEKEQMGERFSIIDAARLPEKPVKPNVLAILLIGLFLGTGVGAGNAALREQTDRTIRCVEALGRHFPHLVVVGIPEIATSGDALRRRLQRRAALIGGCVATGLALVTVHLLVMDLNVFWIRLMRRITL
jgi:protein tyrosine kinase modulator